VRDLEVDRAKLPEDWRTRNPHLGRTGESAVERANVIRAQVSEGLAAPDLLPFADRLAERP
jgi:hypothetical protein